MNKYVLHIHISIESMKIIMDSSSLSSLLHVLPYSFYQIVLYIEQRTPAKFVMNETVQRSHSRLNVNNALANVRVILVCYEVDSSIQKANFR